MTAEPPPGASANPQRAVDVVLSYLKQEGVKVVFGIPGGLLHPFFEAVESDPDLRLVVTKHEGGAAFMADGYARLKHSPAVCAGTSGPGSTNLMTGVACAFADGVPMVVITGQAARNVLGKGAAQETNREDIDIVAMFKPVTKYSTMLTTAESIPHHLRRALRLALSGRRGPVHLNFPVDLWEMPLAEDWFNPRTYRAETRSFDREQVRRAGVALFESERPVLLAGSGVESAEAREHLLALAEMLPARVATTPRGKGLFPDDHPLSLGVLGFAGHRAARETFLGDDVDLCFTVGASLNETSTFNWDPCLQARRRLIQLDIDPDRIGRNYPVDIALVGDAQTILLELIYHGHRLMRGGLSPQSTWNRAPIPAGLGDRYQDGALRQSLQSPLTPQRWRAELEEILPDDAVVFSDIGGHMLFNIHHLSIRASQRFVLNLGFGSMGHGTAAPIGAALAEPGRPVFAIVGDACFTMNGMELITAVEHSVPLIWLVENNNMHGITWHGSKMVGNRRGLRSVRYRRELDVAAIAHAMGLWTSLVDAPGQLADAVREALASGRPAVIEIRVDGNLCPPIGDRARSISGFIRS